MKKIKNLEQIVENILKQDKKSRNDNFVLVLNVYKKLNLPNEINFKELMNNHIEYDLPTFESITRVRRKVVKEHPELQATKKIKQLRKKEEIEYINYAIGGWQMENIKRKFNYEDISINDIESNSHLCFVCDADNKVVIVEQGD